LVDTELKFIFTRMDVLSYLSELIQTRKAVGISGLGTVFKKKIPGRYDAETHSFIPPSYTLDFSDEIKEETLLASFIGSKRNVSTDTAVYFINEFSADTLRRLNNEGSVSFGDLGKLLKSDDQIRFEPAESVNYGFDFYGLPAVKDEQEQLPEVIPQIEDVEDTAAAEEPVTVETPPVVIEEIRPEETPAAAAQIIQSAEPQETLPAQSEEAPVTAEPTLESVISDNERTEENPGDEQPLADEELPLSPAVTAIEERPQNTIRSAAVTSPERQESSANPFAQYKKNEEQLREEIESLNYYRSKSPYLKSTGPADEEVIMKLNKITAKETAAEASPAIDPFPVYPAGAEEPKSMPAYLKILICIGILALMLGILYQIKPDIFNELTGKAPVKKSGGSAPRENVVIPVAEDSLATDSIQKSGASLSPADTLIQTSPTAVADTATVYEVIGASMHDQKEADAFIALMKKSGIDAKVVTNMSGRRLKMSIATLKDEKSAKEELERLSKKLKIPGIYIYRNKQK
jgi:hypothetical protein